ncbi:hypothetical protein DSECCO2_478080 [anaerobic digester metagenome]
MTHLSRPIAATSSAVAYSGGARPSCATVPWTPSMPSTTSIAFPPASPCACCCASKRIRFCSFSRISFFSRSSAERRPKSVLSASERSRSIWRFCASQSAMQDEYSATCSCLFVSSSSIWAIRASRRSRSDVRIRLFSMKMSCSRRIFDRSSFLLSRSCIVAKSWSFTPSTSLLPLAMRSSTSFISSRCVASSMARFARSIERLRICATHSSTFASARLPSR